MRIEHKIVTFIDDDGFKPEMVDQIEKILAHTMIIEQKLRCYVALVRIGDPEVEDDEPESTDHA